MSPVPETPSDLSGDWEGYYKQSGASRRIAATLLQTEDRITGTMRDLETEFDRSLFDAALEAGLPPGADERLDQQLRQMCPGGGKGPIRSKSRLPSDSELEGTVQGDFVTFVKTYKGQHFLGFQVGSEEIGWTIGNHAVEYKGRIEEQGKRIAGVWTIYQSRASRGVSQGPFVLERVSKVSPRG
jgi:hypothetical protein